MPPPAVPDERVQAAIDNWAPRFVSQGVDYNDFRRDDGAGRDVGRVAARVGEAGDAHRAQAEEAEAAGNLLTAGETYVRAALAYHFAKFVWVVDVARNHEATERAKAALYEAHRCLDPTAERVEIAFAGETIVGNLRGPRDAPLVLLLPGLDSTKEEFFWWEDVFLRRGSRPSRSTGPARARAATACRSAPTTRPR